MKITTKKPLLTWKAALLPFHRWKCALASSLLMACGGAQLNTGGADTKFAIVVSSGVDNTGNHPPNAPFSVSASCSAGQTLLGGGYQMINNNSTPTLVVVEGNYPSSPSTWTVQARNPDNTQLYSGDADVIIQVLAYCLATPGYEISTEIVTQVATIPKTANVGNDIDVRCSQTGSLALSGGFKTTTLPAFREPGGAVSQTFWPGLFGTGIASSGPRLPDATHSAMGWHVTQFYTPALHLTAPQPVVTTTVYAICARQNLNAQAYRIASATGSLVTASTLSGHCQTGEFTVGGGYENVTIAHGTGTVPQVSGDLALAPKFAFGSWQIQGASAPAPTTALALCIKIPTI